MNQTNSQLREALPAAGDTGLPVSGKGEDSWPFCAVRGRMIPLAACLGRLRAFCRASGFTGPLATIIHDTAQGLVPLADPGDHHRLVVLTCRIPYEPSWGGRGGLPRPLLLEKALSAEPETTSHAIAPYLRLYRSAGRRILLSRNRTGSDSIALPRDLINNSRSAEAIRLHLDLAKLVATDPVGDVAPLARSGPYITCRAAENLLDELADRGFPWFGDRPTPIGDYLSADMFSFETATAAIAANPLAAQLLPLMPRIVTDTTPQLRAAEIYLQTVFTRFISLLTSAGAAANKSHSLLVAALAIDMRGFGDDREHYLIPWQAYLPEAKKKAGVVISQDDLLATLPTHQEHAWGKAESG